MQFSDLDAEEAQLDVKAMAQHFGLDKDHAVVPEGTANQGAQDGLPVAFVRRPDADEFLPQVECHVAIRVHKDFDGPAERHSGQVPHFARHCGGKEHRLSIPSALADDLLDLFDEELVQHTVGFVQDENVDSLQAEAGRIVQVVNQPTRSGNDDVRVAAQYLLLDF